MLKVCLNVKEFTEEIMQFYTKLRGDTKMFCQCLSTNIADLKDITIRKGCSNSIFKTKNQKMTKGS